MPTPITNQATINYTYGNNIPGTSTSNIATTTLLDPTSLSATKTALVGNYRPGDNITYMVRVVNNGTEAMNNIVVTDDLGSATAVDPLDYVAGSAAVYRNCVQDASITPTVTGGNLVFTIPTLAAGESVMLLYVTKVTGNAGTASGSQITNTAAVTSGAYTVTPAPSATITAANYANVQVFKTASPDTVASGDTLSYTFDLINSGNAPASNVVLTDTLSTNYTPTGVSLEQNGVITPIAAAYYTFNQATGLLTVPNTAAGAPVITVPSATVAGPGIIRLVVTGTVNAPVTPDNPTGGNTGSGSTGGTPTGGDTGSGSTGGTPSGGDTGSGSTGDTPTGGNTDSGSTGGNPTPSQAVQFAPAD